jgi:hypothetical protein
MSLINSAIKGRGLTLPSVEAGFGSMNILRDPPKSIITRYKPKLGDTSKLAEWIDASGDRICEGVRVYARGINPMVSVEYGNTNNQRGGSINNVMNASSRQAFLPYRIMRDGEFRPPIIPPQELLPLSRLPRLPTSQFTNPGSSATIQQLTKCTTDLREVRKDLLRICNPGKAIFNIETPASKPYEIENNINIDKRTVSVMANKNNNKFYTLGINKNPERGIKTEKQTLYGSIPCSAFKNIQGTPIQGYSGNQPICVKERVKGCVSTNVSGLEQNLKVNNNMTLNRNLPSASMMINKGQAVDLNSNISSRQYNNLLKRASLGSFENRGFEQQQMGNRSNDAINLGTQTVYQKAAHDALFARQGNTY